jgi:thiamine biosynthesis lipoprotein
VVSATVTGPDLGVADALATAVFASGGWDLEWMAGFPGYELLVVDSRLRILRSPAIEPLAA